MAILNARDLALVVFAAGILRPMDPGDRLDADFVAAFSPKCEQLSHSLSGDDAAI